MLNEQLLFVKGAVASADSQPTTGSLMRFRDLTSHWKKLHQEMIHILDVDLATLNREAKKADIPAIVLPNQRWGTIRHLLWSVALAIENQYFFEWIFPDNKPNY